MTIVEGYAIVDKIETGMDVSLRQERPIDKELPKPVPIEDMPADTTSGKKRVEELT